MAKRLGVRSREAAATPLRRSPRLKTTTQNPNPNPNLPVSKPHSEAPSTRQFETRSKRGDVGKGKENGSGGKGTGCGDAKEKDSVLGSSVSARRQSPRLAGIGESGMEQDNGLGRKKGDGEIAKLRLEEAGNKQKRLHKLGKFGINCVERRRSARLVLADITNDGSDYEIAKKSGRSRKLGKKSKTSDNDNDNDKISKEKIKSYRLAEQSDKVELNCSEQCSPTVCENDTDKVSISALKPPLPPNQRRFRGIKRRKRKSKYGGESDSDYESEESPMGRKRKRKREEERVEMEGTVEIANGRFGDDFDGWNGWTEEQEIALRDAYLSAKPSPHFWKKVAKMVPGKTAQDCFNKIQSNYATPPSIPAKTRLNNKGIQMDSPFKKFNLLDPNSPKNQTSADPKTRKVCKQKKTRDNRKTLRNLLKKQRLVVDQVQDADYFSQFEVSPVFLPSDVKLHSELCKQRSDLDRPNRIQRPDPSPEVLKRIKNLDMHEKYIDHVHNVDARRKARVKACGNKGKEIDLGVKINGEIKEAKIALVSEANDFIGCYKKLQSDPFGDCMLSDEDDDDVLL